jgi:hypothetical protein
MKASELVFDTSEDYDTFRDGGNTIYFLAVEERVSGYPVICGLPLEPALEIEAKRDANNFFKRVRVFQAHLKPWVAFSALPCSFIISRLYRPRYPDIRSAF